jgi:hypothetical protein
MPALVCIVQWVGRLASSRLPLLGLPRMSAIFVEGVDQTHHPELKVISFSEAKCHAIEYICAVPISMARFLAIDPRDQIVLQISRVAHNLHLAGSLWKAVVSNGSWAITCTPHVCRMNKCRTMYVPCIRLLLHIGERVCLADTALCRHRASSDTVPRQATCASEHGATRTTVDRLGT